MIFININRTTRLLSLRIIFSKAMVLLGSQFKRPINQYHPYSLVTRPWSLNVSRSLAPFLILFNCLHHS